MNALKFDDKLEVLGLVVGAIVVVIALGTLAGQPWATAEGTLPAIVQVIGTLATIAVGILVILVTQSEDTTDLIPGL